MKTSLPIFFMLVLTSGAAAAQPSERIGQIRTLDGSATISRDGVTQPATVAAPIHHGDLIRTGKPGSVGIVLTDNSTITLGSNSELAMTEYAFAPKEGKFSMVMRMVKGTFAYASGLIAKLAPDATQLQMPDATISVRGTKLLVEIKE